jgi:hypothetical protein
MKQKSLRFNCVSNARIRDGIDGCTNFEWKTISGRKFHAYWCQAYHCEVRDLDTCEKRQAPQVSKIKAMPKQK